MVVSRFFNKALCILAVLVFSFAHATDLLDEATLPKIPTIRSANLMISKATREDYMTVINVCGRGSDIEQTAENFNDVTLFGYFLIKNLKGQTVGGIHYDLLPPLEGEEGVELSAHQSPDFLEEFQRMGYGTASLVGLSAQISEAIDTLVPYFSTDDNGFKMGLFKCIYSEVEWMSGVNHPALSMCIKAGFGLKKISGRSLSTDCALVTFPKDAQAFQDSSITALMRASKFLYGAYQKAKGDQNSEDDGGEVDIRDHLTQDQKAEIQRDFRMVMTQEHNIPTIVQLSKILVLNLASDEDECKEHRQFSQARIRALEERDRSQTFSAMTHDEIQNFKVLNQAYFQK